MKTQQTPLLKIGSEIIVGPDKRTVVGFEKIKKRWYIIFDNGEKVSTRVAEKLLEFN